MQDAMKIAADDAEPSPATNDPAAVDQTAVEDAFVQVAKSYGERQGISYNAWREVGVPAPVLKRAGIGRSA